MILVNVHQSGNLSITRLVESSIISNVSWKLLFGVLEAAGTGSRIEDSSSEGVGCTGETGGESWVLRSIL